MKYFIDTEFLEGSQKEKFPISLFRKNTPPTIDLISIGIVAEDGREYYAISKDFNLNEAWNRFQLDQQSGDMRNIFPEGKKNYWIRENVLKSIWMEMAIINECDNSFLSNKEAERFEMELKKGNYDSLFTFKSFKSLLEIYGKSNKQIAEEIKHFIYPNENVLYNHEDCKTEHIGEVFSQVNFYAYYADYDWVAFCWLFGKMMDLPKGFPMYCKDLKQMLDEHFSLSQESLDYIEAVKECGGEYPTKEVLQNIFHNEKIKEHSCYPIQDLSKSHNAIEDARWNQKLHEFLSKL